MVANQFEEAKRFIYNFARYFPNHTTREIEQLGFLYHITYRDMEIKWAHANGYPKSGNFTAAMNHLSALQCVLPQRPPNGGPRDTFRWTVWIDGNCSRYREDWDVELREVMSFYGKAENSIALRVKTNVLRAKRSNLQSIHGETKQILSTKRINKRNKGKRGDPHIAVVEQNF